MKDERATERLQQELKTLQWRTAELEQVQSEHKQMEKALEQRASQLQIIGEVSRKVSSILNLDELLSYVIKAIQESFGYYHADIFLINQDQGYALFKASSNPRVEKVWKEQRLRFKLGEEGMIGWVSQNGEPLLANDVTHEPFYLPNESLPETKSELVVPLKVKEQTLGVLDIQSSELDAFNVDDIFVLETLGNQVAVAIENARLYEAVSQELAEQREMEKALQESEARYRGIFDNAPFGIWISDEEGTLCFANQATLNLFGVTDLAQLIGRWNVFRDTTEAEEPLRANFERAQTGEVVRFRQDLDMRTVKYDTTRKGIVHYYVTFFPIRAGGSQHAHIVVIEEDITEQVRAQEEIYQLSQFQDSIIDNANVWLDVLDEKRNVLIWNKAAQTISGYSQGEVVGHDRIWEWLYPDEAYRKELIEQVTAVVTKGEVREGIETTIRCKDGQSKIISWHERNLLNRAGKTIGSIALGRDITERKRAEKQLVYMATHDPLTGLSNRQAFNDRLKLELAHAHRNRQKLAVMMLDLDYFKDVNDTLGHGVGDQLLQAVGHRLTSIQRKSDTVARLGGDEFMLILPKIGQAKVAEKIAQKLLETVKQPFVTDDDELQITTSIGVAIYPEDAENGETLVKNADIAMYRSKEMGRDNYQCYTVDMEPKASE